MKLSVSNIAWGDEQTQFYRILHECNVSYLDIAPTKLWPAWDFSHDELKKFKSQLLEFDLETAGMQSLFYGMQGMNILGDDASWRRMLEHWQLLFNLANSIEANTLVFGSPACRLPQDSDENYMDLAFERFSQLGTLAERSGTTVAIEPVPEEFGGKFLTTTKDVLDFVIKLNNKAVGINFDVGAYILGEDSESVIKDALPLVRHLHISNPSLLPLDGSFFEQHSLLSTFLSSVNDYDGFLSIEMLYQEGRGLENLVSSIEFAKRVYGE